MRRTAQFLDRHAIDPSGGWLVAVSGGADSMALWRIAAALAAQRGFVVQAAHVNHRLRPSAEAEARQVGAAIAGGGGVCHRADVSVEARGQGLEAAARAARYRALDEIRRRQGLAAVVTGHTADDQAETVLMRLLAGSGLNGLAAMRPQSATLVRPLLWLRRGEALRVAQGLGVPLVDDASNRDTRWLRARLRAELLPAIAAVFGDVVPRLCALADEIAATDSVVENLLRQVPGALDRRGQVSAPRSALRDLPPALRARWLLAALAAIGCPPRRARATVDRFARLVEADRRFSLDVSGASVRGGNLEVQVVRRAPCVIVQKT
ncbi:MAG: tRNA lysidine(34) synthetase TilS [Deltaproteobacteria bacterium]|nr:tRNA lysidine(34) synthetase TilS [Deltaproteobacteria bacterium]